MVVTVVPREPGGGRGEIVNSCYYFVACTGPVSTCTDLFNPHVNSIVIITPILLLKKSSLREIIQLAQD